MIDKIAIVSGKGGTGKTFLTSALALIPKRQVLVDCDVDASNLHLLLNPSDGESWRFSGGKTATIDTDLCIECGDCRLQCRYEAISPEYTVDPFLCEGCSLCAHLCPVNAVRMVSEDAGEYYRTSTEFGPFLYARMTPGAENSGKLVAKLKDLGQQIAETTDAELMLLDGPPGTGCPLISTIAGCRAAIIVTEPTQSGLHDLQRVYSVITRFKSAAGVVINKYDLSPEKTEQIEQYGEEQDIPILGKIPYSRRIAGILSLGEASLTEMDDDIANEVGTIWERTVQMLTRRQKALQ